LQLQTISMGQLTPHQLKTYAKIGVISVFSILCLMLQTALLLLLFVGGGASVNDILPWTVTVITVYFGVIKMLMANASSSSSSSEPSYFTPTPSPNPYVNQPSTPEHHAV
jgi:hypothetical protein